ncbi:hypothetical protein AHiyo8_28160 [Arthrobacter sp. Hiyo8]|nr:hypothetical protein AHiyo8_28160 [Arthrobacter sp. Hiyo8]
MSMPSSRDDVATTHRSRPDLRSSSMSARWSLDTEPWCARARTGSAPLVLPAWAIMCAGVAVEDGSPESSAESAAAENTSTAMSWRSA